MKRSISVALVFITLTGASAGPCGESAGGFSYTDGPKSGALHWPTPRLRHPRTIHVGNGPTRITLSPKHDYRLVLPSTGKIGSLWINGGHNVVLIGGKITIPTTANQTDNGRDNTDTGIYIEDATGTVHIEGLLITGQPTVMFDGIDVNAPRATVQLENIRVNNVWGSSTSEHADVVQTWGGFRALQIDRLTANGDYQGLTIDPDLGREGPVDIRDVDLTLDHPPNALISKTVGGGQMLWLTSGLTTCTTAASVSLTNVFIARDGTRLSPRELVWPQAGTSPLRRCHGVLKHHTVTWPRLPIAGRVVLGRPPGGSFVPTGVAGSNYVSPGYDATARG